MKTFETIFAIIILTFVTLTSFSQTDWMYSFNSNGNNVESAMHQAVDNQGNIYITGYTTYQGIRGVLLRLSPTGYVVWVKYFTGHNGGTATGLKVLPDTYGNIYVCAIGASYGNSNDFWIYKFDNAGNQLFATRFGEPQYQEQFCDAMFDNSGNIIVALAGRTAADSSYNLHLLKYNTSCTPQLYQTYNAGPGHFMATKLLKDLSGNIFVVAYIDYEFFQPRHNFVIVVKYSPQFQFMGDEGIVGSNFSTLDLATGEMMLNNDVIILASLMRPSGENDLTVVKMNNNLNTVWRKDFNFVNGQSETATDLEIDNNNNIYILGNTLFGGSHDVITAKLDIDGNLFWNTIYDRNGFYDYASDIKVDNYGNVYCAGLSGQNANNSDAMIIKFNSNGIQQFVYNYNGFANNSDGFASLHVSPAGIITASGQTTNIVNNSINYDIFTVRLTGNLTGLIGNSNAIPESFSLEQNYPNPFNPSTTIKFSIPANSKVKLAVFNSAGQVVAELVNEELNGGTYEYQFNASKLSSGVYFYKLITDNFTDTKKMILVK